MLENFIESCCGIGFASPCFDFVCKHAKILYNDGSIQITKEDGFVILFDNIESDKLKSGASITVEMDMKNQIGNIYDLINNPSKICLLRVKLPKVAVVVNFNGNNIQKITVSKCGYIV